MKKKTYLMIFLASILLISVGCVEKKAEEKLKIEEDEVEEIEEDGVEEVEEVEVEKNDEDKDLEETDQTNKVDKTDKIKEDQTVEETKKTDKKGEINMTLEQLELPKEGEEIAIIKTNQGDIKLRLFPQAAPKTVENFVTHAKNGYYDGIIFHRVMEDFMIQGGDPTGTGMGGESIWGQAFEDEFDPSFHNLRGSLSMANSGQNTNGSQFFIVQKTDASDMIPQLKTLGESAGFPGAVIDAYEELGGTPWLDFKHTVFGQVFEGIDIVDKIAKVKTGANDKPSEDVIMETIEIVEYKK